jgi:hypothetical protein
MKKIILLAAALPVIMSAACAKENSSSVSENVQQAARDPSLQAKTFVGDCRTLTLTAVSTGILTGQAVKSTRTSYLFDGAGVTRGTQYFAEANCQGGIAANFKEFGSFNLIREKKSADEGVFIDMNFDKLKISVDNEAGLKVAQGLSLCGVNDWQLGQEREVTARSGDVTCHNLALPRAEKNIYKLEGTTLFLGNQTMALRSPEGRPTSLDRAGEKYAPAQ